MQQHIPVSSTPAPASPTPALVPEPTRRSDQIGENVLAVLKLDPVFVFFARQDVFRRHPPVTVADDQLVANVDEQAVLHHTGNLVEHQRKLARVADALQVQVDDVIALIGHIGRVPVHPHGGLLTKNIH